MCVCVCVCVCDGRVLITCVFWREIILRIFSK